MPITELVDTSYHHAASESPTFGHSHDPEKAALGGGIRIEPVIGHTKAEHRMSAIIPRDRRTDGDRVNAVLELPANNFSLPVLAGEALRALARILFGAPPEQGCACDRLADPYFADDSLVLILD